MSPSSTIVRTSSKSTYVSLARASHEFTIQIHGHHEEARLDTIQLSRATDLKSATVRMPDIRAVDLRELGSVLPPKTPVEIRKGALKGSLKLDMDQAYWTHGPLDLDVSLWSGAHDPVQATEIALAQHLPALAVNGEQIPNGEFELLVDGECFPGITSVKWGGVLGFFTKVRLGGSTGPLLSYVRARAHAEKRPTFFVDLAYETKSGFGRAAFTACTWMSAEAAELDCAMFRAPSFHWRTQSKASG